VTKQNEKIAASPKTVLLYRSLLPNDNVLKRFETFSKMRYVFRKRFVTKQNDKIAASPKTVLLLQAVA
jgi:hypothetical protein